MTPVGGTAGTADRPPTGGGAPERLAAAFGKRVARWAREQGAPAAAAALVQRAAAWVSQATSDGHSCMALADLAASFNAGGTPLDIAALRSLLMESRVVGPAQAPDSLPLILDDERLYLHRYFDYECRLASSLAARGAEPGGAPAASTLSPPLLALLDRLFAAQAPEPEAPDWQKIAAITALLGRLTIVSGGPGTGKTTTVVNLLACLLEADPHCRIALTAPTGKAAARMTEVIRQRAGHLPDTLRARLPQQSSTIHRLLGSLPNGEFRHHAGNELAIDVLVVDEASMLDLALAVHLIEAVPTRARVILLGDKDQLAAVESGAVFSELSARPAFSAQRLDALSRLAGVAPQRLRALRQHPPTAADPPHGLEDCVVWLRRNYRFAAGSAIGLLAAATKDGDVGRVLARLKDPSDRCLVWIDEGGSVPSPQAVHALLDGYALYIEAVRNHAAEPKVIAAAFARFRVLCAMRDGPWGVHALNQRVSSHCRRVLQHPLDPGLRSEWYPGRPVMVLRNDPVLALFNGDIGLVLPDAQGVLQVYFPAEGGGCRAIAPARLPDHETAFAMTVHKSQGSEFDEILLVLPAEKNRILTRELLYTAVTRARHRLVIAADATVLATTVETATQRVSGLAARVRRGE